MNEQKIMESLVSIQTTITAIQATTMSILEEQNKMKEELRQEIKESEERTKRELRQEMKELRQQIRREIKETEKNIINDVASNMTVFRKYVDNIANQMEKYQAV